MLVTKKQMYLLTDARYIEAVKNLDNITTLEISPQQGMVDHLKILVKKNQIKRLGVEEDDLKVSELRWLEKVVPVKEVKLHNLRVVKTDQEIRKIEQACELGDKAFRFLLGKIKSGMNEKQVAFELEFFVKKHGAELSFDTIVAFGENSAVPHHQTGGRMTEVRRQTSDDRKQKTDGQFVLLDFGIKVDNYCSDMTRTIFYGKASNKQKKIYQTVLEAQTKAADFLNQQIKSKKKVIGKEVDQVARDYIISQGFPAIPHGLGHGIGLEVHEAPRLSPKSDDEITEGMVFSIEPGIYIPGYGGVRIEDLYVVEKSGLRQLTGSSKDIIEL